MTKIPRDDSTISARENLIRRQEFIGQNRRGDFCNLFSVALDLEKVSKKNCENLVGSVELPVGIAGPLTITQDGEKFDALVPLATTEGALVASVNRGCGALTRGGGISVIVQKRGMTRAPVFVCQSGSEAIKLAGWLEQQSNEIQKISAQTSQHIQFLRLSTWIRGRLLYARFNFDTDQAMGMNMVTLAVEKICQWIEQINPQVKLISISSNACTDKKDSFINQLLGRGYWVQAEGLISPEILTDILKTNSKSLLEVHWAKNLVGSNLAGSSSQNAHVSNVLAAVYLATGQDPAHVVDGSQAQVSIESEGDGIYVAVTLPSVVVGVVGGGTDLPAQVQARQIMVDSNIKLDVARLAGIVGGAALAGELSLLSALASQDLAKAHRRLGRA